MRADFVHWQVQQPAELCYWLGGRLARDVYAGGRALPGSLPSERNQGAASSKAS